MLASVSVLGRAELGSFGVTICVGIEMFIVNFTVQFACLCDTNSLRSQINLHHCSPGETVRGESAKSVAKCCLSVKIVRSCRDVGEMQ